MVVDLNSLTLTDTLYNHVLEKTTQANASISKVCQILKDKLKIDYKEIELIRFYEAFLKRAKFNARLLDFYCFVGEFEKARDIATEEGFTTTAAMLSLNNGDQKKIDLYEPKPESRCTLNFLASWLRYHHLNCTLLKATKGFVHCSSDGNGLVQLYLGNVEKAKDLFNGDAFDTGEELFFKLICELLLSNLYEAEKIYVDIYKRDITFLPLFDLFYTSQLIQKSLPKVFSFHFMSKASPLYLNRILEECACSGQLIYQIAKEYPNPFTKFYAVMRSGCVQAVAIRTLGVALRDKGLHMVDQMVATYCAMNNLPQFMEFYGEMRFKEHPHPFFIEMVLRGRCYNKSIPHSSIDWLCKTEVWIKEYVNISASPENITDISGYVLFLRNAHQDAMEHFNLFHFYFGYTPNSINGIFKLLAMNNANAARTFILERVKNWKHEILLFAAEFSLKDDLIALIDFYMNNLNYHPSFKTKLELAQKVLEASMYEQCKNADLLSLGKNGILILNHKIRNNIDCPLSYTQRAYLHFENGELDAANKDLAVGFSHFGSLDSLHEFEFYYNYHPEFMRLILNHFPKEDSRHLHLTAITHFRLNEWEKARQCFNLLLRNSDNFRYKLQRILCFFFLENYTSALYFLNELEILEPDLENKISDLKQEIEKKLKEPETSQEKAHPSKKESKKPSNAEYRDFFKMESPQISEAKQAHIDRKKEEGGLKTETPSKYIGSRYVKDAVDPIIHVSRSHFDPTAFKPKDNEPENPLIPTAKPVIKTLLTPLFTVSLDLTQKAQVEYSLERLKEIINLEEFGTQFDPEIREALIHRNYLYTYLRVFGILFELAYSPLKEHLYKIRHQVRHDFIANSLPECRRLMHYLKEINFVAQLEKWIKESAIPSIALSPHSLLDEEKYVMFENLSPLAKDSNRIQFMKDELDLSTQFMAPIKTLELFKKEGFHQNATKSSLMMIAKSWTKLSPELNKMFAFYFRNLNLEGNKSAHISKDESRHDNVIFKLDLDDISIESLWTFGAQVNSLKSVLERWG